MIFYIRNFFALISLQSKRLAEDRANAFGQLVMSIVGAVTAIIFIDIFFSFTASIAGWNKNQVLLLVGLYRVFSALFTTFFLSGINLIPQYVRSGELDIFLTKPINTQFYASLRAIVIPDLSKVVSGLAIISLADRAGFIDYLLLLIGLTSGLAIFYGIYFMIATLVFWTGRLESLYDIHDVLSEPLSVPLSVLGKRMSFVFTYIIPLGFVVTFPAEVFLGMSPSYVLLVGILLGLALLVISSWFWNFALRHYTSASS